MGCDRRGRDRGRRRAVTCPQIATAQKRALPLLSSIVFGKRIDFENGIVKVLSVRRSLSDGAAVLHGVVLVVML